MQEDRKRAFLATLPSSSHDDTDASHASAPLTAASSQQVHTQTSREQVRALDDSSQTSDGERRRSMEPSEALTSLDLDSAVLPDPEYVKNSTLVW